MRRIAFGLGGLLLGACVGGEPKPPKVPLGERAAVDFDCPRDQLDITNEDDQLWQVRGCNRVGYYVKRCGSCLDTIALGAGAPLRKPCDCEWVLTRHPAR